MMNVESVRAYCKSFPHATENVQWGDDLVFKLAGRMFAVIDMRTPARLAFKCTPEKFAELVEIEGIIPAPYMARNKWVSVERHDVLAPEEMKKRLRGTYDLEFARLTRKMQASMCYPLADRRSEA